MNVNQNIPLPLMRPALTNVARLGGGRLGQKGGDPLIVQRLDAATDAVRGRQDTELPPKSDSDGSCDMRSAALQARGDQNMSKRRNHDAACKAWVALEALKGERTVS